MNNPFPVIPNLSFPERRDGEGQSQKVDDEEVRVLKLSRRKKKKRRRNKPNWTISLFPIEKSEKGDYYCADCQEGNDVSKCRKCGRNCWRWCDGEKEECDGEGYYSIDHKCFERRSKKPRWKITEFPQHSQWTPDLFPSEKNDEGEYYCADCRKGSDISNCRKCRRTCWRWCDDHKEECDDEGEEGYYSTHHKCFKRKKISSPWKISQFPSEEKGKFFCADCQRGSDVRKCRKCGRFCWRWCDGDKEECDGEGYYSVEHKCFERRSIKPRWKIKDFPQENVGVFYCADCQDSNDVTYCSECGRGCWKWCEECVAYRVALNSHTHMEKSNKKRKRDEKEKEEEVKELEPSRKKRKLD